MAARYTVYLRRSAAAVTPPELLAGTRSADLRTIAENDDIPDADVNDGLKRLRMENVRPPGFEFYRLCYRPEGLRQIDVNRWQTADQVQGVVAEVLDGLKHPALAKIRAHLELTVDIIDASFGSSLEERFAPVLASEVTRWLAEHFDGIIRAADNSWWDLGHYQEYHKLPI